MTAQPGTAIREASDRHASAVVAILDAAEHLMNVEADSLPDADERFLQLASAFNALHGKGISRYRSRGAESLATEALTDAVMERRGASV